jgi:hypothetical protein
MFAATGLPISLTGINQYFAATGLTGTISELLNITFSNNIISGSSLTVANTGKYLLNMTTGGSPDKNSAHIISAIFQNGTPISKSRTSTVFQQSGDDQTMASSTILNLLAGDIITIHFGYVDGAVGTVIYTAHSLHVTLVQIG